jgi:hypothetical protein
MRSLLTYYILSILVAAWILLASCQKDSFITSPDASVLLRADTLRFDTVFTSAGSVTKRFTLVNDNDQKLRIDRISLSGGAGSAYAININGQAAPSVSDIDVRPNDSLYIFVRVTINPNNASNPFIVRDSIQVEYNTTSQWVQLEAYGQNARFINGGRIGTNTTWDAQLPWVILNPLTISAGATLTMQKGVRVFCNANAPIIVNGSLRCLGGAAEADRIVFRGDRTDAVYRDYPGGWPGIVFAQGSTGNLLQYTNLLNAYQAIIAAGDANVSPAKLLMEQCVVDNAYDVGLFALNSSVVANNCRFTQIGNDGQPGTGGSNVIVTGGGNYIFQNCTLATYANFFQNHKQPVLYIGNSYNGTSAAINTQLINCIVYGEGGLSDNEIIINRASGPAFNVLLQNVLYKTKDALTNVTIQNAIVNQPPQFDSINTSLRYYNFRLRDVSPAVNSGRTTSLVVDLDGLPRLAGIRPDIGSYERQ